MKKLIYILILLSFNITAFSQEKEQLKEVATTAITNINVYPNPFQENTNINFYSSTGNTITFIVQDLFGNIITTKNVNLKKGKNTIPFYRNKLSAGIYIYTFKTKNNVISKRFVIK